MHITKTDTSLIRGQPVYYWIGNPHTLLTGAAGDSLKIQPVFTEVKFNRFILDFINPIEAEYKSSKHEYLLQDIDPSWIVLQALQERERPLLLPTADLTNIDLGLVYIDNHDMLMVIIARNQFYSLKTLI